jgi:hypothetical protein
MSRHDEVKVEQNIAVHDEGLTKRDEAAIAVAEEHELSIRDVLRHNKRIVWWCFFFSMSAIGWLACLRGIPRCFR